jgi:hypothetical protein
MAKSGRMLLPLPCKRWKCPVCGPRKSRELARVLVLDARADPPNVAVTLTTSDPLTTAATFRAGNAAVWRRLRRMYGRVEYAGMIEHTTGKSASSGGHRRMHSHNLVKGIPTDQVLEVERIVRDSWRNVTGAYIIEVAALVSPGAALGYLALHHRKPEQAAPDAWSGMTFRPSQGYFHRPIVELREQARHELQVEAFAYVHGVSAELAELELAVRPEFELRRVVKSSLAEGVVEPWAAV